MAKKKIDAKAAVDAWLKDRRVEKIVVVGLGYVGLPLAYELAKHYHVMGYDIDKNRVRNLKNGWDMTREVSVQQLQSSTLGYTTDPGCITEADVVIVTVPTPVTRANVPDLTPVKEATKTIAQWMAPRTTIIYESTVYPGVTEDICVPILSSFHGNGHLHNFWVGYSPERINPGDKVNTLTTVTKVVSGDCPETLDLVDSIYSKITKTHRAPTIRVAEAAKVIENTQRDVNIALMNELAQIFAASDIDTYDVLAAAGTKWNFLPFTPGLVGGHCISVDPYYLTHMAASHGIVADVILSARKLNDSMAKFIAMETLKLRSKHDITGWVTVLGCTFKENVPDLRNSKVFDIIRHLSDWSVDTRVYDTHANAAETLREHQVSIDDLVDCDCASTIILAVPHEDCRTWEHVKKFMVQGTDRQTIVVDVKGVLPREEQPAGVILWRP